MLTHHARRVRTQLSVRGTSFFLAVGNSIVLKQQMSLVITFRLVVHSAPATRDAMCQMCSLGRASINQTYAGIGTELLSASVCQFL